MTAAVHPRLVRIDVLPHPGGGVVITTPRGRSLRVHLEADELNGVLLACDGRTALHEVAAGHPQAADLLALLERLQHEGCLTTTASSTSPDWVRFAPEVETPDRPTSTTVVIAGSGRLADLAARLLQGPAGERFAGVHRDCAPAGGGQVVTLVFADRLDHELLVAVDQARAADRGLWSYLCFDQHAARFGPHVTPGGGPSYADLHARKLAAATHPDLLRAREHRYSGADGYLPPETELTWILSTYLLDVERWLAGGLALGLWHEVALDPVTLATTRHPVLPMPDAPPALPPAGLVEDPMDLLVDDRLGIVTGLTTVDHPEAPALKTVHAAACDISQVREWRNDSIGGGSTFSTLGNARKAAIGEVVERYCGNIIRPELLTRASYAELIRAGDHAVDPDSLALFSPSQYAARGFPFVPVTRARPIDWVRGRSLTADRPAWLPASLVYVNWYNTPRGAADPATNPPFYAGIAAGGSHQDAVLSGLLEIIERHATMVWWLNRQPLPALDPGAELGANWSGSLDGRLIAIDNEFGVPVLAGVVEDAEQQILTLGFAARTDPAEAALKAWAEGVVLQEISRDLLRESSAYGAEIERGRLPDQGLKPWRADRRYLDDYRADFRDVITLLCQTQVHLDPRAVDRVRPWVDVPIGGKLSEVPGLDGPEAVQAAVEAAGYEVFAADITSPDVAAAGLSVVRTVVPGTIGNVEAAFPYLGNRVAQDSAVRLGWRSEPLEEADLTRIPIPHA